MDNVRRKSWTLNENSRLCALHFEEECLIFSGGRKRLTSTAVPTIFDYSLEGKCMIAQAGTNDAEVSVRPASFTVSRDHKS